MKKIIFSFIITSFMSVVIFSGVLAAHDNNQYLSSKPSFFAGLWSNFKSGVSLIIRRVYSPTGTPVPVVKTPTGQTMQGSAKSGKSPGPLYIPGQFGFGGTGGVITSTPFPLPGNIPKVNVSNIGSTQGPTGMINVEKDVTPGGVKPYPTPQPPLPYPKPATDETMREKVQQNNVLTAPVSKEIIRAVAPKVLELVVTSANDIGVSGIKEGSQVQFFANLKLSDGTSKDVTKIVKWMVLGDVGSISVSGMFTGLLGPTVSEYGEGSGSVTATYSGTEGVFLGKSVIFKVYASAGNMGRENIGGQ